jgi:hypothetical protein
MCSGETLKTAILWYCSSLFEDLSWSWRLQVNLKLWLADDPVLCSELVGVELSDWDPAVFSPVTKSFRFLCHESRRHILGMGYPKLDPKANCGPPEIFQQVFMTFVNLILMDPCIVDYSVEIKTSCSFVIEFTIWKFLKGPTCFERCRSSKVYLNAHSALKTAGHHMGI